MTPRVVIVGYDPAWPAMYEEEKALILGAIGPWVKGIEHVGSTSVPGLAAKPIIDIMVGVWNLDDAAYCIGRLVTVGYDFKPDDDIPERRYFNKGPQARHRHLHMTELGGEFWLRHLLFRDYLRSNPETARRYEALKRDLAARCQNDSMAYTDAKTDFIQSVEEQALREMGVSTGVG